MDGLNKTVSHIDDFLNKSETVQDTHIELVNNITEDEIPESTYQFVKTFKIYSFHVPQGGSICLVVPIWKTSQEKKVFRFTPQITFSCKLEDYIEVATYLAELIKNNNYNKIKAKTFKIEFGVLKFRGDEIVDEDERDYYLYKKIFETYLSAQSVFDEFIEELITQGKEVNSREITLLKNWIFYTICDLSNLSREDIEQVELEGTDEKYVHLLLKKTKINFNSRHFPFETFPLTAASHDLIEYFKAKIRVFIEEADGIDEEYYAWIVMLECINVSLKLQEGKKPAGFSRTDSSFTITIPEKYRRDNIYSLVYEKQTTMFPINLRRYHRDDEKLVLTEYRSFMVNFANTFDLKPEIFSKNSISMKEYMELYNGGKFSGGGGGRGRRHTRRRAVRVRTRT